LECSISKDEKSAMVWERPVFDYATGELIEEHKEFKIFYFDTAVRVRPRAKQYCFPKGEDFEAELRRLLKLHDIRYTETEKGYTAAVRQYLGSYEKATVSETKTVCFPDGAILVPMDQINANIAAFLFEPDFIDSKDGAIPTACARFIPCRDGAFPIYRN
ncbi:MAG: hypothetical protein J5794_05015, partial [Lachnospiraceae bacterium]|nr:hypothetical protein [Lachnospiraceae bacterium]